MGRKAMGRPAYSVFTCTCGERCVMVPHEKSGKLNPITVNAYPNGNIRVNLDSVIASQGSYGIVPKAEREANPIPRPVSHWSQCPHADNFRRR
jgi:hypothetical protein